MPEMTPYHNKEPNFLSEGVRFGDLSQFSNLEFTQGK